MDARSQYLEAYRLRRMIGRYLLRADAFERAAYRQRNRRQWGESRQPARDLLLRAELKYQTAAELETALECHYPPMIRAAVQYTYQQRPRSA